MIRLVQPTGVVFINAVIKHYILGTVPPSRRIEDRIRNLSRQLMQAEEDSHEFQTLAAELRFAVFTLKWQIQAGLKNYPPELDRRVRPPTG